MTATFNPSSVLSQFSAKFSAKFSNHNNYIKIAIEFTLSICVGLFLTIAWARTHIIPRPSPLYLALRIVLAITVTGAAFGFWPIGLSCTKQTWRNHIGVIPTLDHIPVRHDCNCVGLSWRRNATSCPPGNVSKWEAEKAEKAEKKKKEEKAEQQLQEEVRDLQGQVTALTASVKALESANAQLGRRVTELQ
ncbi:hypothetical protein N7527_010559 [Penicillium freii]|nr:hypothetical protein N7527_010559 [Penicillium freii]